MQKEGTTIMETESSGCRVSLLFSENSTEGTMEKIRSILSSAYDERVRKVLADTVQDRV